LGHWQHHAIWWHVFPLGFTDAEHEALPPHADPLPRLRRLMPWLDYLVDLGANGLALGPVFAAETHGYDTIDHLQVDPRLGTDEDLRWLFATCRDRGIRVLLDGVFNHVGRGFGPFRDVRRHGRDSAYADWFRIDWGAEGEDGFGYDDFEGHRHLVALNHDNAEVADHIVTVMDHWLEAGADGWRLDAAYAVPQHFWRTVTDRVRARHPEAWFVGEVIHEPYAPWLTEGGLDAITQYELWKSTWSSLNDGNFFELAWTLERHGALVDVGPPLTFTGNHDVTRLASQLDDERHVEHAALLLLTLPGIPSIYAGDEQGFTGVKEEHLRGDDAVRPAFPADPDGLAPFGWPLYHRYQELIGIRRRHPWLATAEVEVLELDNTRLAYAVTGDGERLVVTLNIGGSATRFDEASGSAPGEMTLLAAGADQPEAPWELPPGGWAILQPVG
jgi:cyclomaltodextrinase / maltogenic alpha-amylase / neopullulanase